MLARTVAMESVEGALRHSCARRTSTHDERTIPDGIENRNAGRTVCLRRKDRSASTREEYLVTCTRAAFRDSDLQVRDQLRWFQPRKRPVRCVIAAIPPVDPASCGT